MEKCQRVFPCRFQGRDACALSLQSDLDKTFKIWRNGFHWSLENSRPVVRLYGSHVRY